MKLYGVLLMLFMTLACEPELSSNEKNLAKLEASKTKWVRYSSTKNYSYVIGRHFYTSLGVSPDAYSETTIKVSNRKVIERSYFSEKSSFLKEGEAPEEIERWVEAGTDIGTHTSGSKAALFDKIFDECLDAMKVKKGQTNSITFDKFGYVSECRGSLDNTDCPDCPYERSVSIKKLSIE